MRRTSTWLSRLALALLAVAGFVAPLAEREADRVVQTSGASGAHAPALLAAPVAERAVAPAAGETFVPAPGLEFAASVKRYLLHRAWLI